MRTKNTNRQLDAALAKSQDKFRHTRPEWRQFERILSELGLDKRQIMIAEHAALQVGLTTGQKLRRQFMGIDKYDTDFKGDPSLPMPGGNGQFHAAKVAVWDDASDGSAGGESAPAKDGWVRHLGVYLKK